MPEALRPGLSFASAPFLAQMIAQDLDLRGGDATGDGGSAQTTTASGVSTAGGVFAYHRTLGLTQRLMGFDKPIAVSV